MKELWLSSRFTYLLSFSRFLGLEEMTGEPLKLMLPCVKEMLPNNDKACKKGYKVVLGNMALRITWIVRDKKSGPCKLQQ